MSVMTRRALLRGGAALVGGASLFGAGSAAMVGCASGPPAQEVPLGNVHPLTGIVDFDGVALPLPPILGSVTLLDFWASWCGPCRQAFPHLDQLFRTYQGDGLKVLGISVDDDPKAARRFWASMRPRFPVAWDESGMVRERFKVQSLPTTMLFDADGMIVQRNEGFDPADHRLLEEHVHRLVR